MSEPWSLLFLYGGKPGPVPNPPPPTQNYEEKQQNFPPTLESCPFNFCLVQSTSSFSIHSGEMDEALATEVFYYLEESFKHI